MEAELTGYLDVAQVSLYVFWVFFAGLIVHLQMESRREGFPLENDAGQSDGASWIFTPTPKTFHLPNGHGTRTFPNDSGDVHSAKVKATPINEFEGTAYRPTSADPMGDSIGPGAWTERMDVPDMTFDGQVKIVPMRSAKEYSVAEGDVDPRGLRVFGCDTAQAGVVVDIWVDKAEQYIRYIEVALGADGNGEKVLLPFNFCVIKSIRGGEKAVYVHAITGAQFAGVPSPAKRTQITLLEEDKIMAYYGGGLLYATPNRTKPALF